MKKLLVLGLLVGGGMSVYGMDNYAEKQLNIFLRLISARHLEVNKVLRDWLTILSTSTSKTTEQKIATITLIMQRYPNLFESKEQFCDFLLKIVKTEASETPVLQAVLKLTPSLSKDSCGYLDRHLKDLKVSEEGSIEVASEKYAILMARIEQDQPERVGDGRLDEDTNTGLSLFGRILGGAGVLVVLWGLYSYVNQSEEPRTTNE